jgi:hypothetical protein
MVFALWHTPRHSTLGKSTVPKKSANQKTGFDISACNPRVRLPYRSILKNLYPGKIKAKTQPEPCQTPAYVHPPIIGKFMPLL